MKLKVTGIGVIVMSLMLGLSQAVLAKEPPVAKLVQVEGEVEYSRNGKRWIQVRRTKYLFAGYKIRTGEDGSGKLINQQTGDAQDLGSNSEIEMKRDSVLIIAGNLSEPKSESGSIFQSLMNKFAKAQRYTTVRRSLSSADEQICDNKVRTVRKVTLSSSHPDLVWRNACPEFSYRLVIDGKSIHIPGQSTAEMIRFTVADVEPGDHSYHVEVMDVDGTVYIPRKDSSFSWITKEEEATITAALNDMEDDIFEQTSLLEVNSMYVAAMDTYRTYFQENPDDNDMRPLLIQSYQDLKLSNLRESEARLYNAALEDDF